MRTGPNSVMLPVGVKEAVTRHQVWQESLRGQNVTAGHSPRKVESLA